MRSIWWWALEWGLRILIGTLAFLGLATVGFGSWLLFYTFDLPGLAGLRDFAPAKPTNVQALCNAGQYYAALPTSNINPRFFTAFVAAEGPLAEPGVTPLFGDYYRQLDGENASSNSPRRSARLSVQIARLTTCASGGRISRRLSKEIRTALQIERKYGAQDQLTMYANAVYFENGVSGIDSAAQFYFHKPAQQLTTAEAATLAGLIRSPSVYSPFRHPDRALKRRNEVIQRMAANGAISIQEAQQAMFAPLI